MTRHTDRFSPPSSLDSRNSPNKTPSMTLDRVVLRRSALISSTLVTSSRRSRPHEGERRAKADMRTPTRTSRVDTCHTHPGPPPLRPTRRTADQRLNYAETCENSPLPRSEPRAADGMVGARVSSGLFFRVEFQLLRPRTYRMFAECSRCRRARRLRIPS